MAPRPAYVHPSGLSPAEHDTYAAWIDELDSHISKLGRGLRFGEMLAFIRKRTVVDREAEIMSFFGSIPQQQSLGVGEFIAILRLLAHARSCSTLTRDHIFIQTHPLVFTIPLTPQPSNPFLRAPSTNSILERLDGPKDVNLRDAAAKKKRLLPPLASSVASISNGLSTSPVTPKASSRNPFRMQPTPESPAQELTGTRDDSALPSTRSEPASIARSPPPFPPRPPSLPKQAPPKHVSQLYRKLDDGTQTPTYIKPLHVPAIGPTSLDIISSSLQPDHTGQSTASSTERKRANSPTKATQPLQTTRKSAENTVRLLGSSHIGVDAKPLRARTPARHSSSSEDFTLHKNASDSSLSSLSGMLPRERREPQSSAATPTSANLNSRDLRALVQRDGTEAGHSFNFAPPLTTINQDGQTTLKGLVVKNAPPIPPPPRRRPESLHMATNPTLRAQQIVFGSKPSTGHPGPYSATSIQSMPPKGRTNSVPSMSHGNAASVAGTPYGHLNTRPLKSSGHGITRTMSVSHKHTPLDTFIAKGRDVSQEWLEKAKAGMLGAGGEDRQGLIMADEVTYTAKAAEEDSDTDVSEANGDSQHTSVQERRREIERTSTEEEPGWARLE